MPLELRIIEDEADLAEFQRIMTAAFSTGGMTAYMVNRNPTPEEKQKSVDRHIKSWREESDITGAKWRINDKERTQDQIKAMLPVPGPDEAERPAMQDFMNYLTRVRLEHMGTKPFYCKLMCHSIKVPG
jgi:predicted aconitase